MMFCFHWFDSIGSIGSVRLRMDQASAARTASAHRRPEYMAPWIDDVSRWSPQTKRPSSSATDCFGENGGD
jgi:hypothetical protein